MSALLASDDFEVSISNPPTSDIVNGEQVHFNDFEVIVMHEVNNEGEDHSYRLFQNFACKLHGFMPGRNISCPDRESQKWEGACYP